MTFLQKFYGEQSEVEKPDLAATSNEWLDDEEELKTVPVVNNKNNKYNVVSDSKSDDKDEKNLFDEDFDTEV